MRIDADDRRKIIRNASFSLLIYALPIVLMFLTFYVRGQRPWEKTGSSAQLATNK
jgi:preprotein translocase subunit YajC